MTTGAPGYATFYGTSAAGPHAAAIAALALQARPAATAASVRAAFGASALDIEAQGWDINSGGGIVMAPGGVSAAVIGAPSILPGGVVVLSGNSTTLEPGSLASVYGANLAAATVSWKGDYPPSLGGASVTVNGKSAFLLYASPDQLNFELPDDIARGPVTVTVTTAAGSASSTVTLADFGPSLNLISATYPAAVILTPGGQGAYGGGTYDLAGLAGTLGFATRPARAGETVVVYGTGFGAVSPAQQAGKPFAGYSTVTNTVQVTLGSASITPISAVMYAPGVYQIAFTVPAGTASGDQPLSLSVGGASTQAGIALTVQ